MHFERDFVFGLLQIVARNGDIGGRDSIRVTYTDQLRERLRELGAGGIEGILPLRKDHIPGRHVRSSGGSKCAGRDAYILKVRHMQNIRFVFERWKIG